MTDLTTYLNFESWTPYNSTHPTSTKYTLGSHSYIKLNNGQNIYHSAFKLEKD